MAQKIVLPPHFPPVIIPVCIYHRNMSHEWEGYLATPAVTIGENNMEALKCISPNVAYQGWYQAGSFYAINPMYSPIPSDMILMCAKQSNTAEKSYNTSEILATYDPFHIQDDCVYFLTWTMPKPYTTPLYLYKSGNGIFPSFKKMPDLQPVDIPTIYVLTDKPSENTIFVHKDDNTWFKTWKDGSPDFRFSSYLGTCIPDPNGESLEKCTLKHDIGMIRPVSLLDYLKTNSDTKTYANSVGTAVPTFFRKTNTLLSSVILGLFLLSLAVVSYTLFKQK
jgi:hypothetical protein